MKLWIRLILLVATLGFTGVFIATHHAAFAQTPPAPETPEAPAAGDGLAGPGLAGPGAEPEVIEVEIDWIAELWKGGLTVLVQLLLSVAGLGIAIERILAVRRKNFAPPRLLKAVLPMGSRGDWAGVASACEKDKSVLSSIVKFIAEHRHNELGHVTQGAGDIGVREMRHQLQKTYPLAVVGSIEPLLGLLGTMIGMIEAFGLVALYGDEGGASLLAGSIAKALITTAVGLVIAIPALGLYYYFKQRIMSYMAELETSVEAVIDEWFLKPEGEARARAKRKRQADAEAARASRTPRPAAPSAKQSPV